ncbi:MAG: phosphoglycerol geranylgeranyltransferase [Bacteroidia bacterium]
MDKEIYNLIIKNKSAGRKLFAVLIDPDKFDSTEVIEKSKIAEVDFIMVGGSILSNGNFENCIVTLKKLTTIPIIIFPGNNLQISKNADALLLLSLISGRNPELLIGKHVVVAPLLKSSQLEILPTGYMLIESGKQTAALYMSNTNPIPHEKDDIASCTALAGELLGLKLIYMDAGSGALNPVSVSMIKKVSSTISVPLIIGGGISSVKKATDACKAGADIIVVGNAIENDLFLIEKISKTVHSFNN